MRLRGQGLIWLGAALLWLSDRGFEAFERLGTWGQRLSDRGRALLLRR